MSIFHVLKYPISTPPSEKEFRDLPSAVFTPWLKQRFQDRFQSLEFATSYYHMIYMNKTPGDMWHAERDLADLRRRLMEYEE